MRLSALNSRRIRHNFLPVYIKKQWKEHGSVMTAQRLRIPKQALVDPALSEIASQAEDTFEKSAFRYKEALAREIEIGATAEERAEWNYKRTHRLAQYVGNTQASTVDKPPSLLFDPSRLFCRDIAQAAMLTNTIVRQGSPTNTQILYDQVEAALSKRDSVLSLVSEVERSILHAHTWHTDEDRLPKRYNPDLLIWKFKTEFGIHPLNVARYLLHNLIRICHNQAVQMDLIGQCDPDTGLPERWLLRDRRVDTSFNWGEEDSGRRVQLSQKDDFALLSKNPLPLFETGGSAAIPDNAAKLFGEFKAKMNLISPLIDLTSTKMYPEESSDGIRTTTYPYPHLISVNVALPNTWSDFTAPERDRITVAQRQTIGIMNCYASCVSTAKRIYGNTISNRGPLPEPIAVEAVCTDGVFFDFIAFQLNTLEVPNWNQYDEKLPESMNFAWVDGNHELVQKRYPKRSMLRNTKYANLDMRVFYRFFARYLYGAHVERLLDDTETISRSVL
nr:39S ribosomal protein L37 mitochondrial [Hymenolepis microstoma]